MIKKIKLESFKYRFLVDASKLSFMPKGNNIDWKYFLENLNFEGDTQRLIKKKFKSKKIVTSLSLSDDSKYAVAFVTISL